MARLLHYASRSWPSAPLRALLALLLWCLCLGSYAAAASALLPAWAAYHTVRYLGSLATAAVLRKMGFQAAPPPSPLGAIRSRVRCRCPFTPVGPPVGFVDRLIGSPIVCTLGGRSLAREPD